MRDPKLLVLSQRPFLDQNSLVFNPHSTEKKERVFLTKRGGVTPQYLYTDLTTKKGYITPQLVYARIQFVYVVYIQQFVYTQSRIIMRNNSK